MFLSNLQCQKIWTFNYIENKHALCCEKDCMKNLCSSLKENAKNITVKKIRNKITSRCKIMLCLRKKNLKKAL